MNEDIVTIHIWRKTAEEIVDAHTLTLELFAVIIDATKPVRRPFASRVQVPMEVREKFPVERYLNDLARGRIKD